MGATARDGRGREAPKDKNDLMRGRPGKTTAKGVDVNDGARLGGRVCARAWTAVDRDNRGRDLSWAGTKWDDHGQGQGRQRGRGRLGLCGFGRGQRRPRVGTPGTRTFVGGDNRG